jgi:hypothetical protein
MDTLISRHLPVITNRLQFFPQNICPPPVITPRINFAKRLASDCYDSNSDSDAMDINATPATPPADVGSDSGDETADLLAMETVDKKIPKPRGQAGHPGCGGYSLDIVLRKWGSKLIKDVNVNN